MCKLIGRVLLIVLALAVFGLAGNEDRRDNEVTQENIKQVAAAGIVYSKPSAYRMASPTPDEMEAAEALLDLQPLVRR